MKTKKITLTELKGLVKDIIKEETEQERIPEISKLDFKKNRVIETDDIKVILNYMDNPEYYLARYYDKIDNEHEGSYGSPNYRDVVYDIINYIY